MTGNTHSITVVGLGPGDGAHLTQEAIGVLSSAPRLYLRTEVHPVVADLRADFPRLDIQSFDDLYERSDTFDEVYAQIVERLLRASEAADVYYGVPGSPTLDEASVRLLLRMAGHVGRPVVIVQGLSYVEPVLAAVGPVDTAWLMHVDATEIALIAAESPTGEVQGVAGHLPWRAPLPTVPVLISQLHSRHVAVAVKLWLSRYWPEQHDVMLVHAAGTVEQRVRELPLHRLDREEVSHLTSLYVPPISETENLRTFEGVMNVTRTLRAPGGCAWDRDQTHSSLKPHLLDEAYEVIEALDEGDSGKLAEELGDLLFQITIHSQVAAEHAEFEIEDVFAHLTSKLIARHPHVFADMQLDTAEDVLSNWETFKQRERPERESILSGIPTSMPALPYSFAMQKRVANQGFDWPDVQGALRQVRSEIEELAVEIHAGAPRERLLEELGDILFALVSLGRWLKVDPEEALRTANRTFARRFQYVEAECKAAGVAIRRAGPKELERLWSEAKTRAAAE